MGISHGSPESMPVRRCHALLSATSASSSTGTYQIGCAGELLQPEIFWSFELHDLHLLAQQSDEREEQRAVEPVLVEIVRRDVRGRDHDDALLEQPREQPAEDHRVGDVGDVEFVEAQEPGFLGERVGNEADRVAVRDAAGLHLLAHAVEPLVHVRHELMEMRAPLALHRARGEEQVHQHGLAAPDVAVNIKPLDRAFVAFREQPAQMRGLAGEPMMREPRLEPRQPGRDGLLRGVAFDLAFADEGGVSLGDCGGHRRIE